MKSTKMKTLIVASCLTMSGLLAGCASNCVVIASGGTAGGKVKASNGVIEVIAPASRVVSGNMIQAKVNLQNNSDKVQNVQYRFSWYTADGFNAGESTPWQPVSISPTSTQVVSGVSPSAQAVKYNVEVCKP